MIKQLLVCLFLQCCLSDVMAATGNMQIMPINPLNMPVRMTIPLTTTTVGQAAMYVLEPTGYKFAVGAPASLTAAKIALLPIPPEAFNGEVMRVKDALLMLIGNDNRLLVDEKHRLISFDRRSR